jgi:hypothetical protein
LFLIMALWGFRKDDPAGRMLSALARHKTRPAVPVPGSPT